MRTVMMLMIAGLGASSLAIAEPRQRLDPAQADMQQVEPGSEKMTDQGDSVKGPNAYGKPSTEEGRKRLGNSDTPGTVDNGSNSGNAR